VAHGYNSRANEKFVYHVTICGDTFSKTSVFAAHIIHSGECFPNDPFSVVKNAVLSLDQSPKMRFQMNLDLCARFFVTQK